MVAKTALVVDDSKSARLLLQKTLEKFHIQVESCASVKEALALLDQKQPDIIFLDYVMHETNGLEAIPLIRNKKSCLTIPIIMCSSQENIEYRTQSLAHGALDFLPKPCSPRYLAYVLQKISPNFAKQKNTIPDTSAFDLEESLADQALHDELKKLSHAKKEISHNKLQTILDDRLSHLRRVLLLEIESSVENTLHKTIKQFEQHLDILMEDRIKDHIKNSSSTINENSLSILLDQKLESFKEEITNLLKSSLEKIQNTLSGDKTPNSQKLLNEVKNLAQFTASHQASTAAEKIARESAMAIAKTISHEQIEISEKTIATIQNKLAPKMKLAQSLAISGAVISIIALAMALLTLAHPI